MSTNEGSMDRATRMILGIALMAIGLSGTVAGVVGTGLVVAGVIALATGVTGSCPVYHILKVNTLRHHG